MTRLIEAFPQRTFILVGDTGQHDPEAYGQVMRGFPDQILLTLLRDVTCCQPRDSERYQQAFREVPADQWHLFREPGEIRQIVLDAVGNVRGKQQ
jgi:phosphatidate phosphatase APP1